MNTRSSGSASGLRQITQPTPGYTSPYLWPDVLIDCTRGSRKSQKRSGSRNGAMNPPDAASTWTGMSSPCLGLQLVERGADVGDGLVAAVEGRPEHRDDADGVLVAALHRLFGVEVVALALHRREAGLDVPVAAELLPADLDVGAHHHVGLVGGLARPPSAGRASATSAPSRRAWPPRSTRSSTCRSPPRCRASSTAGSSMLTQRSSISAVRGYSSLSIMFLSNVSAISSCACGFHPRGDERGEVEPRVAVEHQLVVDELVRDVGVELTFRQRVTRRVSRSRRPGCRAG